MDWEAVEKTPRSPLATHSAPRPPTLEHLESLYAPINVSGSTFSTGCRILGRWSEPPTLGHNLADVLLRHDPSRVRRPRVETGRLDVAHEAISVDVSPLGRRCREREGPTTTWGDG